MLRRDILYTFCSRINRNVCGEIGSTHIAVSDIVILLRNLLDTNCSMVHRTVFGETRKEVDVYCGMVQRSGCGKIGKKRRHNAQSGDAENDFKVCILECAILSKMGARPCNVDSDAIGNCMRGCKKRCLVP